MSFARLLVLIFSCTCLVARAEERILSFVSELEVKRDATLDVKETIEVVSEGRQIIHGLMREFPTRYKDRFGNAYMVGFTLKSTLQNAQPIQTRTEDMRNGIVLYLGDPNRRLLPGRYTYVIEYSVTRELGFFKDFDELYWNVTGNGWRLPIDFAGAIVTLPEQIEPSQLKLAGYTGPFGAQGKNYQLRVDDKGKVVFKTTHPLDPYEGLTIAVGWPKGFVHEPDMITKILWFLSDNRSALILLLALLIVFFIYLFSWLDIRKKNRPGTIIPLFEPPNDMLPSEVRFLSRMGFDAQALSAEIVNLAVLGYITITYKKGFFKGTYTLERTPQFDLSLPLLQRSVLGKLFSPSRKQLVLTKGNDEIDSASQALELILKNDLQPDSFYLKSETLFAGILISIFAAIAAIFWMNYSFGAFSFLICILLFVLNLIFSSRMKYYTESGRQLMDRIEGFKLFLTTAETERMKVIGTPPTKTPELYEKYLPYAMALGVEDQWTRQFTPIFEKLTRRGKPYQPVWYHGPGAYAFNVGAFSSDLNSSLTRAISSSVQAPGSSSGSGGGGSSGGGGGGGGGGGW